MCNRNQENIEATLSQRNAMESSFFATGPWSAVSSDRSGIASLKARLDGLLVNLARRHFQQVADDLLSIKRRCDARLQGLGPPRTDSVEQRLHLIRIAASFQDLTARAVDAYYSRDKCFSTNEHLRLATRIKALQDAFSSLLRKHGATRGSGPDSAARRPSVAETISDSESDQEPKEEADVPDTRVLRELSSVLPPVSPPVQKPQQNILVWIRSEFERSRGFELGAFHPSLLPALYHEQMKHWRYFTLEHIGQVVRTIHVFILDLLQHVCADDSVREQLWVALRGPILQAYERPIQHAELLLQIEERGNPRTLNHYFAITLKKRRLERVQTRLKTASSYPGSGMHEEPLVRTQDVVDMHTSNDDQILEDLHDILQSYYKVARKQFVDAVTKGVVDYLLLLVENGPLSVCSPAFIASLSAEELNRIAGEASATSQIREKLTTESRILEDGFHVLQNQPL